MSNEQTPQPLRGKTQAEVSEQVDRIAHKLAQRAYGMEQEILDANTPEDSLYPSDHGYMHLKKDPETGTVTDTRINFPYTGINERNEDGFKSTLLLGSKSHPKSHASKIDEHDKLAPYDISNEQVIHAAAKILSTERSELSHRKHQYHGSHSHFPSTEKIELSRRQRANQFLGKVQSRSIFRKVGTR